jgi:hypothetical protein
MPFGDQRATMQCDKNQKSDPSPLLDNNRLGVCVIMLPNRCSWDVKLYMECRYACRARFFFKWRPSLHDERSESHDMRVSPDDSFTF